MSFHAKGNERVTVSLQVGSRVKITILQVEPVIYQTVYRTVNQDITRENETIDILDIFELVLPTIDNQTYWEDYVTRSDSIEGKFTLKGATITHTIIYSYLVWELVFEYSRNWKSGWLTRFYEKKFYKNGTLFGELEYIALGGETNRISGLVIPMGILSLLFLQLIVRRRMR